MRPLMKKRVLWLVTLVVVAAFVVPIRDRGVIPHPGVTGVLGIVVAAAAALALLVPALRRAVRSRRGA